MNTVRLELPKRELDLDVCLFSGQVFRWKRLGDGQFAGVDGPFEWHFYQTLDQIEARGNGSESDLKRFLRLDEPLDLVQKLSALAPEQSPIFEALRGLRLLRPSCPREMVFSFVCASNINLIRIGQILPRVASLGKDGRFPELEVLASTPESTFRELGLGYRAKRIPITAQALLDLGGEPYLETLKTEPLEDVMQTLDSIHGIGRKLAACMALYAFDKTEAVPVDTHLWQATVRWLRPEWAGVSLTNARHRWVEEAFQSRFGQWSGHAQLFLYLANMRLGKTRSALD